MSPWVLAFVALALGSNALSAQTISGVVAEQVTLEPVPDAVLTLYAVFGAADEPVATGTSDEAGAFLLRAPGPGRYRIQADHDGLTSPLSDILELDDGRDVVGIALLVPSRLLMMAYACAEDREGWEKDEDEVPGHVAEGAVVVGVLRDRDNGIPLPQATVTARWLDGAGRPGLRVSESDAAGRYRLCHVPIGRLNLQASLLGREAPPETINLPGGAIVFHDVEIALGGAASGERGVIQERTLVESAARGFGDLTGTIVDQGTDAPVSQAVVRIRGSGFQGVTDAQGRFAFPDLVPGVYLLEIRHLGYAVQTDEVEVPAGMDVRLRLRIAPRAIEIAGIDVRTRSAVDELARLTPARRDVLWGSAMAVEERRGASVPDVLRRSVPGLRVIEVYRPNGPPLLCLTSNRRIQRLQGTGDDCTDTNPQLVIDGVRIDDLDVLRTLSVTEIESIEFLTPLQAQTTHGIGGRTANGVVVVHTRGRGPWASDLRNVP